MLVQRSSFSFCPEESLLPSLLDVVVTNGVGFDDAVPVVVVVVVVTSEVVPFPQLIAVETIDVEIVDDKVDTGEENGDTCKGGGDDTVVNVVCDVVVGVVFVMDVVCWLGIIDLSDVLLYSDVSDFPIFCSFSSSSLFN
ncbi:hypothetical protein BLA29_004283 [Euroglyphus maynei]|uniref:Uncharacterized protein n=1 Tax=Euroglyphus maynei TaxID=6958 RepID=A0A1Y3AX97_EURMA|nr:hypothetical protein BLA29_004283 [Euroglyphus maynei]